MSDPVTQSDVEDVLSSVRRLVGEAKPGRSSAARQESRDKLVLTPQLRVAAADVLVLRPEDAVGPAPRPKGFAEPPLDALAADDVHKEPSGEKPFLLENAVKKTPPRRTDVTELTAKIAALETAIAKTVDQWEPDGPGRDEYSGTQMPAMDWPHDVELDATGKPMKPPSDLVLSAVKDSVAEAVEEQVIDEEMLRQIVSEIVRAELQGALGERITHNLRKLVRREIQRTLAAQSLD